MHRLFLLVCAALTLMAAASSQAAPANDHFQNATLLSGVQGMTGGSNIDASGEAGEPFNTDPADVHSVWYRWVAPATGPTFFSTAGSSFDTLLGVYEGASVDGLIEIAWNDDSNRAPNNNSYLEFTAIEGTTYYIAVDGYFGDVGSIHLDWGIVTPINDKFTDATPMGGYFGNASGNNAHATSEAGEPTLGNSIWFRWVAPTNGAVVFDTTGSAFDTMLCVYTGASVSGLTSVVCDDNGNPDQTSRASFVAQKGVAYRISVRGANGANGEVRLRWTYPGLATTELLPDLFVWASEEESLLHGWEYDFAEMPGRVLLRLSTATPNVGNGPLELQGDPAAPEVYQRIYRGDGSFADRLAGTFTFHPTHQHLHFDNFMHFQLREVVGTDGVGAPVGEGHKTSFAVIDLDTYDLNTPGASPFEEYGDGLRQGISVGWTDIYSSSLPDQWIDITDVLPGWYWLEATVDPEDRLKEVNETNNTSRILIYVDPFGAPANDNFVNAEPLLGLTAGAIANNGRATLEFDEPVPFDANNSLWWRWTAPASGTAVITTEGSDFDTFLSVFTGPTIETLSLIAAGDDVGSQLFSRVSFSAVAGRTYHISVTGLFDETGRIELSLNPSRNNHFANAVILTEGSGETSGSNLAATSEFGEPSHFGRVAESSIWYAWTAPQNGVVTFDTIGSGIDTLMGIYTGNSVDDLDEVGSDDDSAGHFNARVTFTAVAGQMYQIAVDGYGQGIVKLNWNQRSGAAPQIIVPPVSTNVFAGGTLYLSVTATGSEPMSYLWRRQEGLLQNDGNVSGVNDPNLTIRKMSPAYDGRFEVVVSNAFGSVTSSPVRVIVKENARIVFFEHVIGANPGPVQIPLKIQSQGNEYALELSVSFDPAHFSSPQLLAGADAAGATILGDASAASQGRFGITVILPTGQNLAAGEREFGRLQLNLASNFPQGVMSPLGWVDTPVTKQITTAGGAPLGALYVAGHVQLGAWTGFQNILRLSDGQVRLTLNAIEHQSYVIDVSTNLQTWLPFRTNMFESGTPKIEIDTTATTVPNRFYRARLQTGH